MKMIAVEDSEPTLPEPTHAGVIEDVLNLEATYGFMPFSPGSQQSEADLLSPDSPRYIPSEPAIFSLHASSPYGDNIPDAMVVTMNSEVDEATDWRCGSQWNTSTPETPNYANASLLYNPQTPNYSSVNLQSPAATSTMGTSSSFGTYTSSMPLSVVSRECDMDHEEDHFDVSLQGITEEVYSNS